MTTAFHDVTCGELPGVARKTRAAPGIEPGTSRTRSENHATRPSGRSVRCSTWKRGGDTERAAPKSTLLPARPTDVLHSRRAPGRLPYGTRNGTLWVGGRETCVPSPYTSGAEPGKSMDAYATPRYPRIKYRRNTDGPGPAGPRKHQAPPDSLRTGDARRWRRSLDPVPELAPSFFGLKCLAGPRERHNSCESRSTNATK